MLNTCINHQQTSWRDPSLISSIYRSLTRGKDHCIVKSNATDVNNIIIAGSSTFSSVRRCWVMVRGAGGSSQEMQSICQLDIQVGDDTEHDYLT